MIWEQTMPMPAKPDHSFALVKPHWSSRINPKSGNKSSVQFCRAPCPMFHRIAFPDTTEDSSKRRRNMSVHIHKASVDSPWGWAHSRLCRGLFSLQFQVTTHGISRYYTAVDVQQLQQQRHCRYLVKASPHNSAMRDNVPLRCLASIFDKGIGSLPLADLKTFEYLLLAKISIYIQ